MFSLILMFCTPSLCEEYVVDHNLTAKDCIERRWEELFDMTGESFDSLYKDAIERYQAVAMKVKIERVVLKCEGV